MLNMIFLVIHLLFNWQNVQIVDCKITQVTLNWSNNQLTKTVMCPVSVDEGMEITLTENEWPDEWKDSLNVRDIVKVKVVDGDWNSPKPFPSCAARLIMEQELVAKNKVEGRIPTQLYKDYDCLPNSTK